MFRSMLLVFLAAMPAFATRALAAEGYRLGARSTIYAVPPQKALDLTDEVTLEAWVQADPMPRAGGRILDKSSPGSSEAFMLDTYPANSLRLTTAKGHVTFDAKLPADRWSHIVGVYSRPKKVMKLYLNGKEVASGAGDFPAMSTNDKPLCIGADPSGSNRFVGRIKRAAVYSRALGAEEIAQRAKAVELPALTGVLGEWAMTEKPAPKILPLTGTLVLQSMGAAMSMEWSGEFTGQATPPAEPLSLWYPRPAKAWTEALAVGNGRLGAMVFGGIETERLQLNEDTLWAGGPYDPNNPEAAGALPEARKLIFEGKYREAHNLAGQKMMAKPMAQMPYQLVGDLMLSFPETKAVANYRRDLNLDTAIARVSYVSGGVTYTREVFSSPVDQVIVVRISADKPASVSFSAGMRTPQKATISIEGPDTLVMEGVNGAAHGIAGALKFQCRVKVMAQGGRTAAQNDTVSVSNADSATLLIAAATSYKRYNDVSNDPETLAAAAIAKAQAKDYGDLAKAHITEHQRLFRRVSIDLGTSDAMKLPTDQRIKGFASGADPQLAALYYQFGRYLLISSSRPGTQPANLQGIWNDQMNPPWGSKYTININTEMNYWPAESANLAECVQPLVSMVMDLTETGTKTAKVHWGATGWVTHHNTDIWRASAPIDGPTWGFWPTGGAWLALHLWDHYEYGGDKTFLARIYPALRGASQFFLETLVEEPKNKWLVTSPSISPENAHKHRVSICAGPTMDQQIIRDLFAATIKASEILGADPELREQIAAAKTRLAPNQIGKAGQLQ
jgi:alpha-L-fucosidase 2